MNDKKTSNGMEERYQHFERPTTTRPPSIFNLTLWVILVGSVAGLGGYLLANYVLPTNGVNYLNINNLGRDVKISIDQPLVDIANKQRQSIAGVYKKLEPVSDLGQVIFSQDDFLGTATVVTSDGWLITTDQVANNKNVSVVLEDKIYVVKDFKKDEFSGVVFLKIDDNFLQPVNFQLTDSLKIGEKLFTSIDVPNSKDHSFHTTYLSNSHYSPDRYLFTDSMDYYIKISDQIDSPAAAYFNLNGDLIGLSYNVDDQYFLAPAEYIRQSVKHLLNNTQRPKIGIRYIDMQNNSGFDRRGALVYNPQYAAVVYNSLAYKAGIVSGDQIISVNNDTVSDYRTLTSILQNYRIGDTVVVRILRNSTEKDISITL